MKAARTEAARTEAGTVCRAILVGLVCGSLGGALGGATIAALTTKLNFHLGIGAVSGLFVLFCGIYGLLGLGLGGIGVGVLLLVAKISKRSRGLISTLVRLSEATPGRLVFGVFVLALGALFLFGFLARTHRPTKPTSPVPVPRAKAEPAPLVLLCIDGADLDQMILPMAKAGELPTFRRLLRRGTWGELDTLLPTLSPIIWTTLVTGQPAEEHGIHDFIHFRLPGVEGPIFHFPRRSGFPYKLFPRLEKIPGSGFLRAPNTSDLRRAPALWEIVGEHYSVGVYRWLMTWPVEEVNGFMVSGGLFAGPGSWHPGVRKWLRMVREETPETLGADRIYPPEAWEGISPVAKKRITGRELLAYLAPEHRQNFVRLKSPQFKLIRSGLKESTLQDLMALSEKYRPLFTAANFYTVDAFQHRFGTAHVQGGLFSAAVAERYRFTDRQLGRFLATLEPKTNIIIVSDHGFDFDLGHHHEAPPGIFFAMGPAFSRHRRVEGLSVFDIAPLSLHLLGLPLAEDMPGTATGMYREALAPRYLKRHPVATIPTYGSRQQGEMQGVELDEGLKKELESLGYL